jgi:hypothetical protein
MANTLTVNGTYTLNASDVRSIGTIAMNNTLGGDNYVATVQNITASAYQPLSTSSLDNVRSGFFANNDISASIIVALDNAGTKQVLILSPFDTAVWTYSGSVAAVPLWAKSVNPADGKNAELQYILNEA